MGCEEARMLLDAYADGELSAEQERELMGHVRACEACKQEFEAARLLKEMLCDMDEEVAVPLEAQAAWRSAVKKEAKQRSIRRWSRWASAAAAALVLVAGCSFAFRNDRAAIIAEEPAIIAEEPALMMAAAGLVEKDGAGTAGAEMAAADYSVWKKYEVDNVGTACSTIIQLTEEYSGSFTSEPGEGGSAYCSVELPKDYLEDFLVAVSCIGTELESETMNLDDATVSVFFQIVAA